MKIIFYVIGIIIIMILFRLQNKLRKPIYNRICNVWTEDKEGNFIANIIFTTMLIMAFILGLHM